MDAKDVVLLVLGAAAGVVAQTLYTSTSARVTKLRQALRKRLSRKGEDSPTQSRKIIQIYRSLELEDVLYRTRAMLEVSPLPILFSSDWVFEGAVRPFDDDILSLDSPEIVVFPVDERLVDRKKGQGVRIWDGEILYIKEVQCPDSVRPRLSVGVCNYYSYVTLAQRIGREVRRRKMKRPILDKLGSLSGALSGQVGPITLAAAVTSVFEAEGSRRVVALQRRSSTVVSGQGMIGVAPLFGLESNVSGSGRSRYGLVMYNFLKEFLEEFFDLEEVIRAASEPRADVDWIFHLPHAVDLISQVDGGQVALEFTGLGLEISDGSVTIALLAHFTDPNYLKQVKLYATGSWESERATRARPAIEFVDIDDPRLVELAGVDSMHPSSAFSLDLAMAYLRDSPP